MPSLPEKRITPEGIGGCPPYRRRELPRRVSVDTIPTRGETYLGGHRGCPPYRRRNLPRRASVDALPTRGETCPGRHRWYRRRNLPRRASVDALPTGGETCPGGHQWMPSLQEERRALAPGSIGHLRRGGFATPERGAAVHAQCLRLRRIGLSMLRSQRLLVLKD